ncbi:hypothetical protein ACXIHB_10260 [Tenacibaculum sp. IMCC1]|nr:hypothetical protein KUL118_15590 [Tenacibaculum sp. KUL118]
MTYEVGSREHFYYSELSPSDNGVKVKDALKLIENSPYYDEVYESMRIKPIENEFIPIKGATSLIKLVMQMDKRFTKFDITSKLKDVKCSGLLDTKNAVLEFSNVEDIEALKITGSDIFKATTRYSVKSDYLDKIYNADKYLNYCHNRGYEEFIKESLEYIEENNEDSELDKQFRLLKSRSNDCYVRAITSVDSYKDYNIRFSVFIALISLYRLTKSHKEEYYVRYSSASESDIRVVFRRNERKKVTNGIEVGFELELVNDEIKREAVKFNGLFSIVYDNTKTVSLKPDINAKIINFSHKIGVKKVANLLKGLPEAIDEFIAVMYNDIKFVNKSKSPEELKKYLYLKVKNSKQKEFREKYKKEVQKMIEEENVNTFYQLLDLMNKVDLLIDDSDIKAKDYWKYKLYEVLVKGKRDSQ